MRNPNGYGSVHKIGGKDKRRNPWRARVTDGWELDELTGESRQKFRTLGYYPDRQSAMMALAEYNKNPYTIGTANVTFEDIYHSFVKQKEGKVSIHAIKGYKSAFNNSTALHKMKMSDIRTMHMKEIMDTVEGGFALQSRLKTFWGQLFKLAIENDIVQKNYAEFVQLRSSDEGTKRTPFTDEEINILWEKLGSVPSVDMALILCYTGMRPSELLEIRLENIDLQQRIMRGGMKTKAGKNRIIPIHQRILPLIEKRMNGSKEFLIEENGGSLTYNRFLLGVWHPLIDNTGISHTPHECRHTCATNMKIAGVDTDIRKLILGHASGDITDRYTHVPPSMLVEAIDKLK